MAVLLAAEKNQAVGQPTPRSAMEDSTSPAITVNLYRKTFKTTSYVPNTTTYFYLITATCFGVQRPSSAHHCNILKVKLV
jgi:hypothetical protein